MPDRREEWIERARYAPPLAQSCALVAVLAGAITDSFALSGILVVPAFALYVIWGAVMLRRPDLRAREAELRRVERLGRWLLTPAPSAASATLAVCGGVVGLFVASLVISGRLA